MEIVTYRKNMQGRRMSADTNLVLAKTIDVAASRGRAFVEPVDVPLAIHQFSRGGSVLRKKLDSVGLTFDALEDCADGMDHQLSNLRSRVATARMFDYASGLVEDRASSYNGVPPFGLGDLMLAAIASGSSVIDTVIRDGLGKNVDEVLDALGAPNYLLLMRDMNEVIARAERGMVPEAA